ncbi:uncharacterized protein LOC110716241 [Chenopodium quinoa]|uniref:PAR1 protein n=1 Tax=Chenopodium quinoa TaxID=63459 RepID=A0A803NAE2_CHEQI|nr:uncharacterized protein LOC110716241 [Chenopodium quinoa]
MAFPSKFSLLFLFASIFVQSSVGELICEELPSDLCVMAIASSGKRCVLEKYRNDIEETEYQCRTSEVVVERMSEHIETDQCVKACGVDRKMGGISSDNLLEPQFTAKLCSPSCYNKCRNVVDLYFKLAEGEGVYLPDLCQNQQSNQRRAMVELMSSGAAPGPVSGIHVSSSLHADDLAPAPAPVSSFI